MAKGQYSADSAHDPDVFLHPQMLPSASRRNALPAFTDNGDPGARDPVTPVGLDVPANIASTFITLHS